MQARKGARLTAITCGGAIPEIADYRVVTDDENRTVVGTLDEDFAIESNAGDIFLLGNTSWRIKHVRGGEVVVNDAHGAPPTIPFWRGEAPGRTFELSAEVGRLREDLVTLIDASVTEGQGPAIDWLIEDVPASSDHGARAGGRRMLPPSRPRRAWCRRRSGCCSSGSSTSRAACSWWCTLRSARASIAAWGLALRKRFCRTFDFELQASADDNGIVLSLGAQHSFPLEQMFRLVPSHLARDVLVQAFLAVPFFATRWRWNVTRALQLKRAQKGKRVPPHLQRMRADDLLSAVFPAQTACQENVVGDIEVPDQPLVRQTVRRLSARGRRPRRLAGVLRDIESGEIELVGLDSREPSPFAHELLNANPYAFLDDAPLEERRARAVTMRRSLSAEALRDLGRLDPEAIAQVRAEAWPLVRDADELHDVLLSAGVWPVAEGDAWQQYFDELDCGRPCDASGRNRLRRFGWRRSVGRWWKRSGRMLRRAQEVTVPGRRSPRLAARGSDSPSRPRPHRMHWANNRKVAGERPWPRSDRCRNRARWAGESGRRSTGAVYDISPVTRF